MVQGTWRRTRPAHCWRRCASDVRMSIWSGFWHHATRCLRESCGVRGTEQDGWIGMAERDEPRDGIDRLAAAALERWGLAGAPLRMINHSENVTYLVTPDGPDRPSVLRVHRPGYHTLNGIRSELAWIQ